MDVTTLTDLLREAEEHHGPYEATRRRTTGRPSTPPTSSPATRAAHPSRPTPTPGSTWKPS